MSSLNRSMWSGANLLLHSPGRPERRGWGGRRRGSGSPGRPCPAPGRAPRRRRRTIGTTSRRWPARRRRRPHSGARGIRAGRSPTGPWPPPSRRPAIRSPPSRRRARPGRGDAPDSSGPHRPGRVSGSRPPWSPGGTHSPRPPGRVDRGPGGSLGIGHRRAAGVGSCRHWRRRRRRCRTGWRRSCPPAGAARRPESPTTAPGAPRRSPTCGSRNGPAASSSDGTGTGSVWSGAARGGPDVWLWPPATASSPDRLRCWPFAPFLGLSAALRPAGAASAGALRLPGPELPAGLRLPCPEDVSRLLAPGGPVVGASVTFPPMEVLAHYLPQFHPIPENDRWWGPGLHRVDQRDQGPPAFRGHVQPHLPADLGFYDLRVAEARQAQADLARAYGVTGFCYWHYWFAGRQLLGRPFDEVLASGTPTSLLSGLGQPVLVGNLARRPRPGPHRADLPGRAEDADHFAAVRSAFEDPRYVTIAGLPLLFIYQPGGLPEPARFVETWQKMAVDADWAVCTWWRASGDSGLPGPGGGRVRRRGALHRYPVHGAPRGQGPGRLSAPGLAGGRAVPVPEDLGDPPGGFGGRVLPACTRTGTTPRAAGHGGVVAIGATPERFGAQLRRGLELARGPTVRRTDPGGQVVERVGGGQLSGAGPRDRHGAGWRCSGQGAGRGRQLAGGGAAPERRTRRRVHPMPILTGQAGWWRGAGPDRAVRGGHLRPVRVAGPDPPRRADAVVALGGDPGQLRARRPSAWPGPATPRWR